jgi:hypothetical protein
MFQRPPFRPAGRWLARRLVLAETLDRDVIDRVSGRNAAANIVGTKGSRTTRGQAARGFGSTHGVGTTDIITTPLSANSIYRTYIHDVLISGPGGNSVGRVWDKDLGSEFCYYNAASSALAYSRTFGGGQGIWRTATNSATSGNRYVFAITFDSSSAANNPLMYLNGQPVAVTEDGDPVSGSTTDNSDPITIGNRISDSARNWDGRIRRMYVFNSILTAGEILELSTDMDRLFEPIQPAMVFNVPSAGAFNAAWARQRSSIIGAGLR